MYGTVAYLQTKPNVETELIEQFSHKIPGLVAVQLYRMDAAANSYYLSVVFEDKESYFANANSPEQHARYEAMMALLAAEPEWHDGEIVYGKINGL